MADEDEESEQLDGGKGVAQVNFNDRNDSYMELKKTLITLLIS